MNDACKRAKLFRFAVDSVEVVEDVPSSSVWLDGVADRNKSSKELMLMKSSGKLNNAVTTKHSMSHGG